MAEIAYHSVRDTLLRLAEHDLEAFQVAFALNTFKARYATAGPAGRNPFANATELQEGQHEWQRSLLFQDRARQPVRLLCCPEDIELGPRCKHGVGDLCANCTIPLCSTCLTSVRKRKGMEGSKRE